MYVLNVISDLSWVSTTLSMVGKFGVTASYSVIYLMAAEVFPTVIRSVTYLDFAYSRGYNV